MLLEFLHRRGDEVAIGARPQPVSREAEVLEAETGLSWFGDERLAPVVEILDATDLHVRSVDVDPIVLKQILALQDERDDEEVAIAQTLGGLTNGCGDGRIQRPDERP